MYNIAWVKVSGIGKGKIFFSTELDHTDNLLFCSVTYGVFTYNVICIAFANFDIEIIMMMVRSFFLIFSRFFSYVSVAFVYVRKSL